MTIQHKLQLKYFGIALLSIIFSLIFELSETFKSIKIADTLISLIMECIV